MTNAVITDIGTSGGGIDEISIGTRRIRPECLVWTGSLDDVCGLLGLPCRGLEYLSLILFNVELKTAPARLYQWCYYGSKDIIFSRVTMPSVFSQIAVPPHSGSLCVEVSCLEGDSRWNNPHALVERVKEDLLKVNLVSHPEHISAVHIERVPDAYPIYTLGFRGLRDRVRADLGRLKNLVLAGRTGLFWYNNMDNSIENGLSVVKDITREYKKDEVLSGHEV
jgi:protoporphyrinogen oxidase